MRTSESALPKRSLLTGAVVMVAYLSVASWTLGPNRPLRPLFDGSSPPVAYQYVSPPPELADTNIAPQGVTKTFPFKEREVVEGGTRRILEGGLITTPDAQVSMSVPAETFKAVRGATGITIRITPVDPATLGEPPEGLVYEGNGTLVEANYEPSGDPATPEDLDCALGGCLSIVIRYPVAGTQLWVKDGAEWRDLVAENSASTLSLYTPTKQLGEFVVTAIPMKHQGTSVSQIIAFALGGVAVVAAVALQRFRSTRSKSLAKGRSGQPGAARGRSGQRSKHQEKGATKGRHRR